MTTQSTDGTGPADPTNPSAGGQTAAALAGSTVVSAIRVASHRVASWVRGSAIYQWLTAEPDPEVIVIDLRETWTVGPVLRVLDRIITWLVAAAAGSRVVDGAHRGYTALLAAPLRVGGLGLATLGLAVAGGGVLGGSGPSRVALGIGLAVTGLIAMQDERDWATLRETRAVTLAIAALEPPAPPESETTEEATDETDDSASADQHTTR